MYYWYQCLNETVIQEILCQVSILTYLDSCVYGVDWLLWLDVEPALLLTVRWRCVDSGWLMLTVVPSLLTC